MSLTFFSLDAHGFERMAVHFTVLRAPFDDQLLGR
jgi:hypothetical protein